MGGRHSGAVVSAAAAQQEGPGFDSSSRWGQGLSVWSLHVLLVSAWVLSGYSGFLPQSKDMHDRLIGVSKLPVGVNVSEWLSVSMWQPCDKLATCPGCTPPLAQSQLG